MTGPNEDMPEILSNPAGVLGRMIGMVQDASAAEQHLYKLVPWHEVNLVAGDGYLFCSGGVVPPFVEQDGTVIDARFLMYRVKTVADHAETELAQAAAAGESDRDQFPASDMAAGADPLAIPPNRIPEPVGEPEPIAAAAEIPAPVVEEGAAALGQHPDFWPGPPSPGSPPEPVPGSPGSGVTVIEPDHVAAELGLEDDPADPLSAESRGELELGDQAADAKPADPPPAALSPFDPDRYKSA